jgi:hypothetical protein
MGCRDESPSPSNAHQRSEPRLDDLAMMTSETAANRYRREAEECRQNADKAMRPVDREAWLRLAAEWAELAKSAELGSSFDK